MLTKKGFTLVELMVVILIVAILAAVAIPIMRGRIDAAKWSEGRAMMGTVATSIRAYIAEHDTPLTGDTKGTLGYVDIGLQPSDFDGTYFSNSDFDWSVDYNPNLNTLTFTITADKPVGIMSPDQYILSQAGVWTAVVF